MASDQFAPLNLHRLFRLRKLKFDKGGISNADQVFIRQTAREIMD
jgi:hypothetical protein